MENESATTLSATSGADDPAPHISPTTTLYQKLAAAMISSMEATAAEVPGYGDDLSAVGRVQKLLPRSVIAMAVFAVEGSEELTGVDLLDSIETATRFSSPRPSAPRSTASSASPDGLR